MLIVAALKPCSSRVGLFLNIDIESRNGFAVTLRYTIYEPVRNDGLGTFLSVDV